MLSPFRFSQSIVVLVAHQSAGSDMITICQIHYVYTACNLEHSHATFERDVRGHSLRNLMFGKCYFGKHAHHQFRCRWKKAAN